MDAEQDIKNITQTAVTNIMEQRMLLIFKYILNLTFRMLQHTSSEVTVVKLKKRY